MSVEPEQIRPNGDGSPAAEAAVNGDRLAGIRGLPAWHEPAAYVGSVGRTMFDTPGAKDNSLTVLLPFDCVQQVPAQSLVRIVSQPDEREYLGIVVAGPFAEPDGLRSRCFDRPQRKTRVRRNRLAPRVRRGAPSAGLGALGGETTAALLLDVFRQSLHGLLGYRNPLPTRERGVRFVQHREDFEPPAFAFFPERQRFLNGLFLAAESTALDSVLHEGALVWGQLDVHIDIVKGFTGGQHVRF